MFDSKLLNLFELVNLLVCSKNELKPSYPFFQHNIDEVKSGVMGGLNEDIKGIKNNTNLKFEVPSQTVSKQNITPKDSINNPTTEKLP